MNSYLSNVKITRFQVEDTNRPHNKNLVFHSTHCKVPAKPWLLIFMVSFAVRVLDSKTTETAKSSKLCQKRGEHFLNAKFSAKKIEMFDWPKYFVELAFCFTFSLELKSNLFSPDLWWKYLGSFGAIWHHWRERTRHSYLQLSPLKQLHSEQLSWHLLYLLYFLRSLCSLQSHYMQGNTFLPKAWFPSQMCAS